MINIKEDSTVMAYDEYEWIENYSVIMFQGFCRKFPQAMSFKRIFYSKPRFHVSEFLTCVVLVSRS